MIKQSLCASSFDGFLNLGELVFFCLFREGAFVIRIYSYLCFSWFSAILEDLESSRQWWPWGHRWHIFSVLLRPSYHIDYAYLLYWSFVLAGVLEANFVEPAHDKQGFERTLVLSRLEQRLIQMQKTYWWVLICHWVSCSW